MLSRTFAHLLAIGLVTTVLVSSNDDHPNLRRGLQHVVPQQSRWGPSPGGLGSGGFQTVHHQNGAGFVGSAGGGFGAPPPQEQQGQGFGGHQGVGGFPDQQRHGFGDPPPQREQSFGGPPPQQGQGFGGPPPQQGQGFGDPPPQQGQGFGGPPPRQGQGFGGPPPQQGQGFGGPPPQQGQGFGGPPPPQQGQGFGGPPHQQNQGGGGPPPLQQDQGFGGPPPQQEQGAGGPPPQQVVGFGNGAAQQVGEFGGSTGQQQGYGQGIGGPAISLQQQAGLGGQTPLQVSPGEVHKPKEGKQEKKQQPPPPPPPAIQEQKQVSRGNGQCSMREPKAVETKAAWTASFPGSGGKLLWQTIEQLTGILTSDDNDSSGTLNKGTCVAVKTHFPTRHVSPKYFIMDTSKVANAILLVRNPMDVMPSYFKFLYRMEESNGSAEPTVDRWILWRNENFEEQLAKWIDHTKWWTANYHSTGRLMILPFEHVTDPKTGPEAVKALGIFLGTMDPIVTQSLTPESDIGCLWNMMVGDSAPGQGKGKKKKVSANGFPGFPYTLSNLDLMITALKDLKSEFTSVPQLGNILNDYIKKVTAAKRKVEAILSA